MNFILERDLSFRNSSKSPLASSDTREMLDADLIERKDVFEKAKYLFA